GRGAGARRRRACPRRALDQDRIRRQTRRMSKALKRCAWCGEDPLYVAYHDEEWGVPQRDPRMLWEMLMLEGFQAGLAWITVLRKREHMRKAFKGFDPAKVAR